MTTKDNARQNTSIWDKVESTDPAATKGYKGPGGFSGTAVNPTYLNRKATELFGPCGIGWGTEIVNEYVTEGAVTSFTPPRSRPASRCYTREDPHHPPQVLVYPGRTARRD